MPAGVAHDWDDVSVHELNAGNNPHTWVDDDERSLNLKGLAPANNRPTVFIDTEYTGFKTLKKRLRDGSIDPDDKKDLAVPVDVCAIKVLPSGIVEEYESKIYLSDMMRERYRWNGWEQVVGYDPKEWATAPTIAEVAPKLLEFVSGCTWVSWGPEDWKIWNRTWNELQHPTWAGQIWPVCCAEKRSRDLLPALGKYSLAAMCEHFGIEKETAHRARGGAERMREVWMRLVESRTLAMPRS